MKTAFALISHLVPQMPGWCTVNKALTLASIVVATRPRVSLEIGVFAGRSLLPMAMAHRAIKHGKVIGIDSWSSNESQKEQTAEHAKFWSQDVMHKNAEGVCRKMIEDEELSEYVTLEKCPSDLYTAHHDYDIGLLHVDGNHSEQAVRDVQRFARRVPSGGFVVMDDLHWDNQGPKHAVEVLLTMGFRELYRVHDVREGSTDDWGVFQKV